jgi:hypothetical protein
LIKTTAGAFNPSIAGFCDGAKVFGRNLVGPMSERSQNIGTIFSLRSGLHRNSALKNSTELWISTWAHGLLAHNLRRSWLSMA